MRTHGVKARPTRRLQALLGMLLGCYAIPVSGQTPVCEAPEESNEAKLLAFFAAPIAFSTGGVFEGLPLWGVRVAFEATYVPSPSRSIQQPEACYGIKKTENTNLSPVFPRPRITIGLPGGVLLEGSYLPPIKVADAEPNLGSVGLSWPVRLYGNYEKGTVSLLVRGHATIGRVRGSITCPKEKLQGDDPNAACWGALASHDTYKPNMYGGEIAVGRSAARERWGAYASSGVTLLRPRFQVGFLYQNGSFDNTKIRVPDMPRLALGLGGWYRFGDTSAVTGELYSVPEDATTFRLGIAFTPR